MSSNFSRAFVSATLFACSCALSIHGSLAGAWIYGVAALLFSVEIDTKAIDRATRRDGK